MRALIVCLTAVALCVGPGVSDVRAEDPPRSSIKDVMKKAHKGGLLKKVLSGSASDEEKAQLVAYYKDLAAATPKKGDAASWSDKTAAILQAAQAGNTAALKEATNCAKCHKAHK